MVRGRREVPSGCVRQMRSRDSTGLSHVNAKLARSRKQQHVELGTPYLEPIPQSAVVTAECFEPRRAAPLDPDPGMPCADHAFQPIGNAKLSQQGLDARMERLARPVATCWLSFT